MRLLTGFSFLLLLLLTVTCNRPSQQLAARGDFADRLEELCQLITSNPAERNKTVLAFATLDAGILRREAAVPDKRHEAFYPDSVYRVFTIPADPEGIPSVKRTMQTWRKGPRLFYEITLDLESRYHIAGNGRAVFEDPRDGLQVSHARLARYFGTAQPTFPEDLQPKESHYDYYIYINPQTQDTAFIKTRSFMSPASGYNTIYNLSISSSALSPQPGIR